MLHRLLQWLEKKSTHHYINDLVRKLGKDDVQDDAVYNCLIAESGTQVYKYADHFLGLVMDGALIDDLGSERY
jgi:hypothetical protein